LTGMINLYLSKNTKIAFMRKVSTIIITIVVIGLIAFVYWRFFFVFAEGTKAGVLNTIQKKGYVFKTYEGQLIQSGFRGNPTTAIQSNEFFFSVKDERVAQILMQNSGKDMELHYKRYLSTLPWRGMQEYLIDSVYNISNANPQGNPIR
ncbi:MAG TPA: hypothetical protein VF623_00640, partial [Segetibacter sp.]